MIDLFPLLLFAVNITAPILLIMLVGTGLRRFGRIDEAFLGQATWVVFNVAMPAMLFVKMVSSPSGSGSSVNMLWVGVIGTTLVCGLMILIVRVVVEDVSDRGVVVQGAYRANMGVVGLAYCFNAFGDAGLAAVVVYLGVVTVLYNVIAVVLLNHYLHGRSDVRSALFGVLKNPLILAIVAGGVVRVTGAPVPTAVISTLDYLGQMVLPLALLCTGAALNFGALHAAPRSAVVGSLGKGILSPALVVGLAVLADLDAMETVLVFLMASAPTASASYVMVRSFGGNDALASNIIVVTTVASIVFTSLGLMAFRLAGMV
ncbi:MAG: AEC family transporter [Pseudomonadota bacterium]